MKKIFWLTLVVAIFGATFAYGAEEKGYSVKGSLDLGWYSQYIGSLSGGTAYDKNVFQQSLTFALEPVGLYVSGWSSYSPEGGLNSDFGDEGDIYLGIKRSFRGLTFNAGYAFYNMYNLKDMEGDLHGVFFNTEFPKLFGRITPYLWLEKDIPVNKGEGGYLYRAGLTHTTDILKQPINLNLSVAGHDGAYGRRPENISSGKFIVSSDFKVWRLTITPQLNFQKRLGHDIRDGGMTENKVWGGVNISIPFEAMSW